MSVTNKTVSALTFALLVVLAVQPSVLNKGENSVAFSNSLKQLPRQQVESAAPRPRQAEPKADLPLSSADNAADGTEMKPSFEALPNSKEQFPTLSDKDRSAVVLSLIHYPWQKLGYKIVFMNARPGYRAMTISHKRRIEIYARRGDTPAAIAFDVAHELGHAFDLQFNDYERRNQWKQMRGIDPNAAWFGCNRCPDYDTPAGDFAETFAFLLLGPGSYHSRAAAAPTPEQIPTLAQFCEIEDGTYYDPGKIDASEPALAVDTAH